MGVKSGLVGLVGLVIFLSVIESRVNGIRGFSLSFDEKLCHDDDAPARKECRDILWDGTGRFWGIARERWNQLTVVLCCMAHIPIAGSNHIALHDHV